MKIYFVVIVLEISLNLFDRKNKIIIHVVFFHRSGHKVLQNQNMYTIVIKNLDKLQFQIYTNLFRLVLIISSR